MHRTTTILASIATCTAALISFLLYGSTFQIDVSPILPKAPSRQSHSATPGKPQRTVRPATDFRAYAARPLFSPSRRPVRAKAPQNPRSQPRAMEPTPELLGVMIVGGRRSAFIKPSGGDAHWVSEGDTIREWKIITITADHAVISARDKTLEIPLYEVAPKN